LPHVLHYWLQLLGALLDPRPVSHGFNHVSCHKPAPVVPPDV
jgi:hypothetical protein